MNNRAHRNDTPELTYRIFFYLAGFLFAIMTYIIGLWVFNVESSSVDSQIPRYGLQGIASTIFFAHPFTFISWILVITFVAFLLGRLFDREVAFRKEAERRANIDGLTGVYNHRYFQERLAEEIERARRYGRPLSLAMLDLDDFKQYNDVYGHQEGDALLREFTGICLRSIRQMDVLARYGGEEFVLIMPETDAESAMSCTERIRRNCEARLRSPEPDLKPVTVSIGVAELDKHGSTRHSLVLAADTALYYAKSQGKNACYLYRSEFRRLYCTTPERLRAMLEGKEMEAIEALSAAVDAKDHYTCGHSNSVSRYALAIAERLQMDERDKQSLRVAALLHDIGKIGTPDSILRKPGGLASTERRIVECHPDIGSQILKKVQQLKNIVPSVMHHHEWYDGTGYPNRLAGEAIPLFARIIALADAFDAMTSDRPYRPAMTKEQALQELINGAGTQFDPALVPIFVDIVRSSDILEQKKAA